MLTHGAESRSTKAPETTAPWPAPMLEVEMYPRTTGLARMGRMSKAQMQSPPVVTRSTGVATARSFGWFVICYINRIPVISSISTTVAGTR